MKKEKGKGLSNYCHNFNRNNPLGKVGEVLGSYYQKVDLYLTPNLLILDELGFRKLPNYSADDFFEVISRRYEKGSVIITTNKPFEDWGDIFSDNILTSAILKRVVHYSAIIKINGPSYRAKNVKRGGDNGK